MLALAAAFLLQAPIARTYLLTNPAPALFEPGQSVTVELKPIETDVNWTEAVPSWNLEKPENAAITVEARVIYPDRATKYYSFGTWAGSVKMGQSASVKGQKDEDGTVLTDTLRMSRPGGKIQFRLTGTAAATGSAPKLNRILVSLADTAAVMIPEEPAKTHPAWGLVIDPPRRAQGDYPGGKALCSPASVSMVLAYWAGRIGRASLDKSVPETRSGVYDAIYQGTGNWSFNVAFAGSQPGLTGYAARLSSIDELEALTAAGIPVVCSVSWYLLHGDPIQADEQGHLVVLNGFMPNGDPVFNDPGKRGEVRKVYKRSDFLAAWNHSKRTVYVIAPQRILPEGALTPVAG